jgi:hypothetical protein
MNLEGAVVETAPFLFLKPFFYWDVILSMTALIKYIALIAGLAGMMEARAQADFRAIDRHALRAPEELRQNLPALTAYLIEPAKNDLVKVRAIYAWIIHHISYDEEAYRNGAGRVNRHNLDILQRRRAVCFGYASLFRDMCAQAGLQAEVVSGYSKGTLTARPNLEEADHAWNAVRIDDRWYLLDATWDSSLLDKENVFVQADGETYFLPEPQMFVLNHLPNLPMWQLLGSPISPSLFEQTSDSIRHYLSSSDSHYHYQDSIRHFFSLEPAERRLWEAEGTYRFNPTEANREDLGHSLVDFAGVRSDLAEALQDRPAQADSLIGLQAEVIALCRRAFTLMTPYQWQKELYINTLLNQAVSLYQQTDRVEEPAPLYDQALAHLAEGESVLSQLPAESYFARYARRQCDRIRGVIEEAMRR